MKKSTLFSVCLVVFLIVISFISTSLFSQTIEEDYERAFSLREKQNSLVIDMPFNRGWINETDSFWYRKSVEGGFEFFKLNASTLEKERAFDHKRLAEGIAALLDKEINPLKLPFNSIWHSKDDNRLNFEIDLWNYSCDLSNYECTKLEKTTNRWQIGGFSMWEQGPKPTAVSDKTKISPDGNNEAYIKNYNIYIRDLVTDKETAMSTDGSEGEFYTYSSIAWSPDSKKIAAYRLKRGYHRTVHYVESSPNDQLQPKHHTMEYAKPGDVLDLEQPVLFNILSGSQINIDNRLFPNPYEMSNPRWREDGRGFTFEYNQRGHQIYRVIEVDADSGDPRAVISEEPETFFAYSEKMYRHDINDGDEIIWMSEQDGWNHLYLYNGLTGKVKNQITKGNWVVRSVEHVDDENHLIYFSASGKNSSMDPYFIHYYSINFDGSDLTALTEGNFNHSIDLSNDSQFYIDLYSRIDAPPIMELRRTSDRKKLLIVEETCIDQLKNAGWHAPEVFVSKGRDGTTDIWGIINKPYNFDPNKSYPVIEYIYAGPHSSFVPKSFSASNRMQPLAEMGFIVVQIDGMGTNNRSKEFHDVCWKNLGDAGFPDRILWHKAAAEKYSWYDISNVGLYGNSAGGQSTLGGLLFHPEFYKVGVSSCGCHDNRMDKIWWNEQWMGWPIGPEYSAASNVDNAYKLQGKLLLILGEMDTNVDPSSTMQVVDALIKSEKIFDLLVIPGGDHGMGGKYGQRKMFDFFIKNILSTDTPDWNAQELRN